MTRTANATLQPPSSSSLAEGKTPPLNPRPPKKKNLTLSWIFQASPRSNPVSCRKRQPADRALQGSSQSCSGKQKKAVTLNKTNSIITAQQEACRDLNNRIRERGAMWNRFACITVFDVIFLVIAITYPTGQIKATHEPHPELLSVKHHARPWGPMTDCFLWR